MVITESKPGKRKIGKIKITEGWNRRKNDLGSLVSLHLHQSYILKQVNLQV